MNRPDPKRYWLYTALYCGLVLVIYIPGAGGYLTELSGRQRVIFAALQSSPALLWQMVAYALTLVSLHLLPLVLLLLGLRHGHPLRARLGISEFTQFLLAAISLWLAILLLNKLYFPRSSFTVLISLDETRSLRLAGLSALAIYTGVGLAPALYRLGAWLTRAFHRPTVRVAAVGISALSVISPLYSAWTTPQARSTQPNVIIIGIDSLSPLHLEHHPGALPLLERLLSESTVFTQTITPLARTFPAWTSILTARYPINSGARFNLTDFTQVETQTTLPHLLGARGYHTLYAQDERQFNNIDETFGFERVIGPKAGAADLVLSKAADHPLANLTLLLPGAETLFPFIALNRAATVQYDPNTFVQAILDDLPSSPDQPLFLAAHFCLAHLPYQWRDAYATGSADSPQTIQEQHLFALQRLEQQIEALLRGLQGRGLLDDSILVVLSDHGEALGYPDALWPSLERQHNTHDVFETQGYSAFPRSSGYTGHGTDTLDRSQQHALLAFQGFGSMRHAFEPGRHEHISSLVDVMPTLLAALGQPVPTDIDGIDLLASPDKDDVRVIVTETGLRLDTLASITNFDEAALLQESQLYYRVDPVTARLVLKQEVYPGLVASKDLAVHTDDWMLALLRKPGNPYFPRTALLVHKPSGAWTLGRDHKLIQQAPLTTLTRGLQQIYGQELVDFETLWPFEPAAGS